MLFKILAGLAGGAAIDVMRREGKFGYVTYTLKPVNDVSDCQIHNFSW